VAQLHPDLKTLVIPAKAGIHRQYEAWIPAFAGMTSARVADVLKVGGIGVTQRH
jgi:hypothetical protein